MAGNEPMATIFRGILSFIVVEIIVIIVLSIFSDIALYLPNAMDVLPPIGVKRGQSNVGS